MSQMIRILLVSFIYVQVSRGAIWDFGENRRSSKVIAHNTGQMTAVDKIKHIPITVPSCMKIIYVRVEVENAITTPAVSFNKHTNMITIYYKPIQDSRSSYDIVARGVWDNICGSDPTMPKRKKSFRSRNP